MHEKILKIIVIIIVLCVVGIGIFYLLNNPNLAENIVMKIQKEIIKQLNIPEIGDNLICNDTYTKVNKKIEKESDCNGSKIYEIRRKGI